MSPQKGSVSFSASINSWNNWADLTRSARQETSLAAFSWFETAGAVSIQSCTASVISPFSSSLPEQERLCFSREVRANVQWSTALRPGLSADILIEASVNNEGKRPNILAEKCACAYLIVQTARVLIWFRSFQNTRGLYDHVRACAFLRSGHSLTNMLLQFAHTSLTILLLAYISCVSDVWREGASSSVDWKAEDHSCLTGSRTKDQETRGRANWQKKNYKRKHYCQGLIDRRRREPSAVDKPLLLHKVRSTTTYSL